jgi:hypothetical protein
MQNETVGSEAILARVPVRVKAELQALAREHDRSVAGETRAALDAWLDLHRRELLAAWRAEEGLR